MEGEGSEARSEMGLALPEGNPVRWPESKPRGERAAMSSVVLAWFVLIAMSLTVGSFLNVIIHRVPQDLSIVWPGSRCPHCEKPIASYDNIPVLSWLILRGKCRKCSAPISAVYPVVEVLTVLLASVVFFRFGLRPVLFPYLLMTFLLIAITVIDFQLEIIPDKITLPAAVFFLLMALIGKYTPALEWPIGPLASLLGMLFGAGLILAIVGLYYALTRKLGMGMGDVKFLAMAGTLVGWKGTFLILMLGSLAGTILALPLMLLGKAGRKTVIPFGPFLALGTFITMLYGPQILRAYESVVVPNP